MAATRRLSVICCLSLAASLLGFGLTRTETRADDDKKSALPEPPAAFAKETPENVKDLKEIEAHVKLVLAKVIPCTVGLQIGGASGSGVIIDKEGHVLTAGHVSGKPDRDVTIILHDGKRLKGKSLGGNFGIDSGLVKITDEGSWPFVEMGNSADLKKAQWCISVGHPGGFKPGRSPVVRVGRLMDVSKNALRSDCTLVGGDSGGPLFDVQGKVIGIHSRIGARITDNVHVPVDVYRADWDKIAKGETIGGGNPFANANAPYLGIERDPDADSCKIAKVQPDTPADKAGLKADDVITKFAGDEVKNFDDLVRAMIKKKAGDEVEVQVKRGEDNVTVKVTLGKRPAN